METRDLVLKMAEILDKKGALDIQILEVDHMTSITDYFLIASGRNVQSVRSLAEDLEDKLAEDGRLVTSGGRVLGVTATAPTLQKALADAYAAAEAVAFDGKYMRHDIGRRALAAMEG